MAINYVEFELRYCSTRNIDDDKVVCLGLVVGSSSVVEANRSEKEMVITGRVG